MGSIASKAPGSSTTYTSIGGQAVIEGVMMRSPHFSAVAVRKADQRIVLKYDPYSSVMNRFPLLRKPVLRGVTLLVESLIQGMAALGFSAEIASGELKEGEEPQKLSRGAVIGSMIFAFMMGMLLFVALPHLVTVLLTSERFLNISVNSPVFHLIDGCLKMVILLSYVYLISLMKDIQRVFQYHGAEHKSIYAFEAGEDLTVENAKRHSTLHPRCGTSFLLFLVLISIIVFSVVLPLFGLTHLSDKPFLNHAGMIGMKMILIFPVAGLAYEVIKACACRMSNPIFKAVIYPGLLLQKITTREPTDDQLEVALASLRQVLRLEKNDPSAVSGFEISALSELIYTRANVTEFLEN